MKIELIDDNGNVTFSTNEIYSYDTARKDMPTYENSSFDFELEITIDDRVVVGKNKNEKSNRNSNKNNKNNKRNKSNNNNRRSNNHNNRHNDNKEKCKKYFFDELRKRSLDSDHEEDEISNVSVDVSNEEEVKVNETLQEEVPQEIEKPQIEVSNNTTSNRDRLNQQEILDFLNNTKPSIVNEKVETKEIKSEDTTNTEQEPVVKTKKLSEMKNKYKFLYKSKDKIKSELQQKNTYEEHSEYSEYENSPKCEKMKNNRKSGEF